MRYKENEEKSVIEEEVRKADSLVEYEKEPEKTNSLIVGGSKHECKEKIEILNDIKEDSSEELAKFDLKNIYKSNIANKIVSNNGPVDLSLVSTSKNGTCARISKSCLEKLGISIESGVDSKVDFGFLADGVVISKDLSGSGITCNIKKGRNIYAKELINEIVQRFKLDYTGVSTRSFSVTEYKKLPNGALVAIIKM